MERIIAVDPGKFEIKSGMETGGKPKLFNVRSKLYTQKENEHYDVQGNSVAICYDGTHYIIGDQGSETDKTLKKDTILHKVGLMASLANLVSQGDTVHLILDCPASIYKDKVSRQNYRDFMTDNGILSFETATKKFDVTIATTLVLPESSGAPFVYPSIFSDSRVAVLDIGGLNMNFAVYNNSVLDINSMNTVNHGGYELENRVQTAFARFGINLSRDDYEQVVKNNCLKLNDQVVPESREVLESIYLQFISEIPNIVRGFDYDLSLMKVVCIGGTAELLGERIKQVIPHAIIKDNMTWVNVLGSLEVGKQKYKV